ncbi:MAG: oligosaccharide flippase family protein, partial [Clostridia bacterium]|nr:oligosaccharide flippase family protein [Clostridia bacterium]
MRKTVFIKNAAVLTSAGLVLRVFGIVFKIWLTRMIGQAGIGLYQIVFSFYVLASTFATTGIPTAVTRLCGDEMGRGSKAGVKRILRFAIVVMIVLASLTFAALFFGAKVISKSILFDLRASFSIKIMGFSLPFTGICSCFRGYFIARRKATPPAVSQILEQIVRILFVFVGIKTLGALSADVVCGVVMLGDAVAEGISCGFLALVYKSDLSKLKNTGSAAISTQTIVKRTGEIALPIAGGRYLNSFLRTFENVLVPKKLVASGSSGNSALSKFGMIKGSALPVLFFPSTLLNSMSILLLPELSVANGKKQGIAIKSTVE